MFHNPRYLSWCLREYTNAASFSYSRRWK